MTKKKAKSTVTRREFLKKSGVTLGALSTMSLLGTSPVSWAKASPSILRLGLSTDPPSLDPCRNSGTAAETITLSQYEGLLGMNPDGTLRPKLAESWSIDGTDYTFKLRKGVKFHNGAEMTAEDVQYSFERIMDAGTGAYHYDIYKDNIGEIVIKDKYTVVFKMRQPSVVVLGYLGTRWDAILNKEWMLSKNRNLHVEGNGTGPYKMTAREPGVRVELAKFGDYWQKGRPHFDEVVAVPYKDEDARVNALKAGEVDVIGYPPWKEWEAIRSNPGLALTGGLDGTMYLTYNVSMKPFDDPRVRQAMRFALHPQPYIDAIFFGEGAAANGTMIPKDHWAWDKEFGEYFSYDPDRAKKLLAQAGYPNGFETVCEATSTYQMHSKTAEITRNQLTEIGVNMKLELNEWGKHLENMWNGKYPVCVNGGDSMPTTQPETLLDHFGSTSRRSKANKFSSPKYDELMKKSAATFDQAKRKALVKQAELEWIAQSPWTVIMHRVSAWAHRSDLEGFQFFGSGTHAWISSLGRSMPNLKLK